VSLSFRRRPRAYVVTAVALLAFMAGTAHAAHAAPTASTASTASIGGTITDASGNPITTEEVCVEVHSADGGDGYGFATADASGNYEVTGLPAGSYEVYVYDCYGSSRNDLPSHYESEGSVAIVELTSGEAKTGIDVQLAAATSISGDVYGGSGDATPLANACVYVYEADSAYEDEVGFARTEADGAYTLDHLTPGIGYKVAFSPCSSGSAYSEEYYDEKGSLAEADTITPTAANPSTGIDGHLPTGASIGGTVTDAEGNPITTQDVCVNAYADGGGSYGEATTSSSGQYTITGLAAGSYYVEFSDCANSARNDVTQYYGGTPFEDESTLVVLSSGGAKTGVDAQLAAGTSISGHAYAGSGTGTPLDDQCVYVDARSPSGADDDSYYYYGETGSAGEYAVSHIAPISGGYTVEFTDCKYPVTYVSQYFGGNYAPNTASTVTPTVAAPAQGIDAHLEKGGTISGTVTDSKGNAIGSGVCAEAVLTDDDYVYYEESSAGLTAAGEYAIGGLPTGSYDVYFYDCGSRNDVNQALPNAVSVTVGEATQDINAAMQPATSISGHVYAGAGTSTPLGDVCVEVLNADGSPIDNYLIYTSVVDTGTNGSYKLEHLEPSGSYVIEFNTCSYYDSNGYATQFYDGVSELSQADVLTPTLAAPSTGIDAHLPSGAPVTTITGGPAANAATSQTEGRFSFTADVAGATFECALDGGAYSPCASPYDTGTLAAGKHTFTVRATADGQTEPSPRYVTWTIDPTSPTSTSQGEVTSGGTFSSDPGGQTSSTTPVIVAVTPPSASQVTLTTEPPTTTTSGNGYTIFGQQIDIAAAEPDGAGTVTGTASEPIKLVFTLDASQIPAGTEASSVTVTRNGTPAAPCTTAGTASPDPCVESRSTNAEGNLEIVVLTTHCSMWNFAAPVPVSQQPSGGTGAEPGSGGGTPNGGGSTTTTATPSTTPAPSGGVLSAKAVSGSVSLVGSSIAVRGSGEATVKLSCVSAVTCGGKLTVTARAKGGKQAKSETIGTAAFSIPAGKMATVKLKLTAAGRILLRTAHGHLIASLTILKTSPGPSATQSKSVHLTQQQATKTRKKG
jgi:Carboxypeptidase regulatory-like domain